VPTPIMADYYAQRASAGLLISEATGISKEGLGWPSAPGIWTDAQTEGWKPVTEAVHKAGGRIICQLWHMGRIVHSVFNDGKPPVSASATQAPGQAHTPKGRFDFEVARPLELAEIPRLIEDYRLAAENAKKAGFDGVLRDNSNFRDDDYGGSIENRIRLTTQVTKALCDVWSAGRVSVRLSPNGDSQGCDDSQPEALFTAAATALSNLGIGFLELREPGADGTFGKTDVPKQSPAIRKVFKGALVLNSDLTAEGGQAILDSGVADAASYGRPFMANPDLPRRFKEGLPLNDIKGPATWYSPGTEGYTDYPFAS
jgi:2,4-dienoyl-CoA reductase-like NADH-dependent reductase (Old Yellow Enzyme family)